MTFTALRSMFGAKALVWILGWGVVFFAVDQASKLYVMHGLGLAEACPPGAYCLEPPVDVFAPYLRLIMSWNSGVNFGIGGGGPEAMRWVLASFALCVSIGVWFYAARWRDGWLWVGAGMLIGGAVSNAVDRIAYGYVADFLNMSCCGYINPYVFNIADVFIFAGIALLFLRSGPRTPAYESAGADGKGSS